MPTDAINMPVGKRFGSLTILGRAAVKGYSAMWLCRCDCGTIKPVRGTNLRRGETVSCGCKKRKILDHTTHGKRQSSEWKVWANARQRTGNPKHNSYADYGGRGISMCARWQDSFESFYADMGPRLSAKHSLDRYPDQNGNYEPGNCRWATWTEQANNKRNNRMLTIAGRTMTVPQWALEAGISRHCLIQRVNAGRSEAEMLLPSDRTHKSLTAQGREDAAYG